MPAVFGCAQSERRAWVAFVRALKEFSLAASSSGAPSIVQWEAGLHARRKESRKV